MPEGQSVRESRTTLLMERTCDRSLNGKQVLLSGQQSPRFLKNEKRLLFCQTTFSKKVILEELGIWSSVPVYVVLEELFVCGLIPSGLWYLWSIKIDSLERTPK